jgi:hypothetical protein
LGQKNCRVKDKIEKRKSIISPGSHSMSDGVCSDGTNFLMTHTIKYNGDK